MTKMIIVEKKYFDPEKALYKVLEQSVSDTVKVLASKARKRAPKDTGFLIASIKRQINKLNAYIRAWAYYAPYVEFGTMYWKGKPFMRPALKDTLRIVPTIIARAVRRYMK